MVAAPFSHGQALLTERTFFRFIGWHGQVEQRLDVFLGDAEISLAAAAVDEQAHADDDAAALLERNRRSSRYLQR